MHHAPSEFQPEEVDLLLQRCEGGVEAALQYSKNMAKYMKDLINYLEKRAVLGEWQPLGCGRGGHFSLLAPQAPALTQPQPSCRDGLCQRPAEDRSKLQTEHHAGGGVGLPVSSRVNKQGTGVGVRGWGGCLWGSGPPSWHLP